MMIIMSMIRCLDLKEAAFPQYEWMIIVGIIFGFCMSFGIGANDVANAFGTSVAAKTLTLLQAICIAAVMEFGGAVLLGASVTSTITTGIFKAEYYEDDPEIVMLGFMSALLVAFLLLMAATFCELPVSTTHVIVGSLLGFTVAAKGFQSVKWNNVGTIIISWFASPIMTGCISGFIFFSLKKLVFEAEHPYQRSKRVYPVVLCFTIVLGVFFVLKKSQKNKPQITGGVIAGASLGAAALALIFYFVYLQKRILKNIKENFTEDGQKIVHENVEEGSQAGEEEFKELTGWKYYWEIFALATYKQDLEVSCLKENKDTAAMWENSGKYDLRAERMFSYLQVFTASITSFAHGANDVANAISPLAGMMTIYKTGDLSSTAIVPFWVLCMGGLGIVLGFACYGYKIIKAVGYKLTAITPSKGFTSELSTAISVLVASFIGIPVSSTQCLIGAVTGVGLASGGKNEVSFKFLAKIASGWVVTFVLVAILNAAVFSFIAYSPSLVQ